MTKRIVKNAAALFLFSMISNLAVAAEAEYEFRIGGAKSDNIARTDTLEIEESFALAGLILDWQHESRTIEASVFTDLEYRNYTDNVFDDEVVGSLNADLELHFAPDVLSWVFQERFGNLVTNPFLANTPLNRQNLNRFSTGPDLRVRFGSSTAIELSGRYHINQFEISDIDSDTLGGRVSFIHALSKHRSISLNVTADQVEYDNTTLNSNYDQQAAYFGFVSEISRGSLTINLGYNEIDDNADVVDGRLINVSWDRELSPSSTFNLSYDERLTSANDSLGQFQDPGQGFGDPQNTAAVSDPFETRQFSAGYNYRRDSNTVFVTARYMEDDYVTLSSLDRDASEVLAGLSRVLGSSWRFRLNGSLRRTEFDVSGRVDDDSSITAGLSLQFTRTLAVNLDFTRFDRDSSDSSFDYVENLMNLTLSYGR